MKIYLAHALTGAPEEFRQRMLALRQSLNQIPGVHVLEFNWIPGVGPDRTKNTYVFDMDKVNQADLVVGILDHPSIGLGMEIHERCHKDTPMLLFYRIGSRVSQIVSDCITWHRDLIPPGNRDCPSGLYDPIAYSSDEDVLGMVEKWIRERGREIYNQIG